MTRLLPLLLFVAGCSSYTAIDLDTAVAPAGLLMNVTSIAETERGFEVTLELRNDSTRRFHYSGYSPQVPIYMTEVLTESAWVKQPWFTECGTGIAPQTLEPGQRVEVKVHLGHKNRLRRLRVGIGEYEGRSYVWSPVIDLATKAWGVKRAEK